MTIDSKQLNSIKEKLFADSSYLYAIIDGAACPKLRFKIFDWEPTSTCLWSGALEPDIQEVAPYLVQLEKNSTFTDWLISEGWDKNWNIFASSELEFKKFRKQIKKLLVVKSPEGSNLIFRFYDPRVMIMLANNWENELKANILDNIDVISLQETEYSILRISQKHSSRFTIT